MSTTYRKTSYSEVQTFLRCGRQHLYAYGYELTGIFNGEALERGIMGHAALAEYYRQRQYGFDHETGYAAAMMELARNAQECKAYDTMKLIMATTELVSLYLENYKDEPIEVLGVETEYSIGMLDDYRLPVRIDVILRHLDTGKVVAYDHKFLKDFYDEEAAELMPQLPLYDAGLKVDGVTVDELAFNMIRHRGTIASRTNPSERFVRLAVPTTPAKTRRVLEEHLMAANRIKAWRDMGLETWDQKVLRNPNACGMCSFKALCKADYRGEDTELMKEFEYRKKSPREELNA